MTTTKQKSNVALFSLCDEGNVLTDALKDTSGAETTRGDALVFAWRLGLPERMNVAHAAKAVLLATQNVSYTKMTDSQKVIIRELELMVKKGGVVMTKSKPKPSIKSDSTAQSPHEIRRRAEELAALASGPNLSRRRKARAPLAPTAVGSRSADGKRSKDWWHLVGPK